VAVLRRTRRARDDHDSTGRWAARALAAVPDGVLAVDERGRVTFVNDVALELLARPSATLLGLDLHDALCVAGGGHDRAGCPALRALADGAAHRGAEAVLRRGDGSVLAAEVASAPLGGHGPPGAAVALRLGAGPGRATEYYGEVLRLTERERAQREVVRQLQEAVTPRMPVVAGVDLGVHEMAADPTEPSGGDLYDWVVLPDGDLHLVVVDVMGKGVAATKDALAVVHALRVLTYEGCPMDQLVARADGLLTAHDPNLVATLLVARYTPSTGRLRVAGGGHPPAFVVGPDGTVAEVEAPGIPIGWPEAGSFDVAELVLGRSETLVLYTDGLIEARRDIVAGLADLRAALAETARYPVRHLPRVLVERALDGAQRSDDTLALALRRRAVPVEAPARLLGPFAHRFSPVMAAVPLARHLFADWLVAQGVDEAERADLAVVASELCSNAVRTASGVAGALVLRARVEGDALVVEVEDDGAGFHVSVPSSDEVPAAEATAGRGLFLVGSLVDELVVRSDDGGTVVRCVKRYLFPTSPAAADADPCAPSR
jgi:anti-sigma regulatory factor (Ser/Thr protein kinase)